MEATYSSFSLSTSIERIDEILNSSDSNYTEYNSIPNRNNLTFTNGFKVKASCLFMDIRGSKELNKKHTNPVRAKIYRSYISESIAVLRNSTKINEIYVEGDCVWAAFDTPLKSDIDGVFSTAAQLASMIDILNYKYSKKGYSELSVGIGLAWGSSLYIKAGYKGSGINEVVWLGKVIAEAAELCSYGNRTWNDARMMVSSDFHLNLNDENKKLLKWNSNRACYSGSVVSTVMNDWLEEKKALGTY